MSKITLNSAGTFDNTALTVMNGNSTTIQTAMDNTLSRDGTAPNVMLSSLDMNSNRILNLPVPLVSSEPLRLGDLPIPPANLVGGTNTWSADQYFKSGRPWADVRAYGATGNGLTNDVNAFTSAIAAVSSLGGGIVFVPPANPGFFYYIATGFTIPAGVRLVGSISFASGNVVTGSLLSSNNADITVVTLAGNKAVMEGIAIQGGGIGSLNPTVNVSTGSECRIENCRIYGGYNALVCTGGNDWVLFNNSIFGAYGNGAFKVSNGSQGYTIRNKFDVAWPGTLPTAGVAITNWSSANVQAVGDLRIVTNGGSSYILQVTAITGDFKTGVVAPTVLNYNTDIIDNHVTWRLRIPATYYGRIYDTGGGTHFAYGDDHTGPYSVGVAILNSGAGTAPAQVFLTDCNFGQFFLTGILAQAGNGLYAKGCNFLGGVAPGAIGARTTGAWVGPLCIEGSSFLGPMATGVSLETGTKAKVALSDFSGCTTAAISVAAGVSSFDLLCNNVGTGLSGGNAIGINIAAGASDVYSVIANDTTGATLGIVDGGTGVNKTIIGKGSATPSRIKCILRGVDLSAANTDHAISIVLPPGVTNYQVAGARLANANGNISTGTFGLFTAVAGGGTAIIASATAIGITTNAANTNNNAQAPTIVNTGTNSYNLATLQFRVQTAVAASTVDFELEILPL